MPRLTKQNVVGDIELIDAKRRTRTQERYHKLAAYEDTGLMPTEIERLKAEIIELKEMNDLRLHHAEYMDRIDMSVSGTAAGVFMSALIEIFKQNGGKNSVAFTVSSKKDKYSIVIDNCNGIMTAAEKLNALGIEIETLKGENERLKKDEECFKRIKALSEFVYTCCDEGTRALVERAEVAEAEAEVLKRAFGLAYRDIGSKLKPAEEWYIQQARAEVEKE